MKLIQKLMATILTVIMLMGYVSTLGSAVMAVTTDLTGQNSKTNHANVEFNSYFEGENHNQTFEIGENAKIYFRINVSNTGYLKNTTIKLVDTNYEFDSDNFENEQVQSITKNEIKLNQINSSSNEVVIEVPIKMIEGEEVTADLFSKVSQVEFTGTYIDENGQENSIEKEISNEVKWKGTAEVELAGEVSKFIPYEIGEEKGILLQAVVKSGIKDNSLPVASTKLEISIPELELSEENYLKPERITVVANTTAGTNGKGSNEFNEANYIYNEETGKIEIEVTNEEEEGKISWKKNALDEYVISYVYTGEEVYSYIKEQLQKAQETAQQVEEGQVNENAITGEIEVTANIEAYNSEETKIEKTGKISYSIEEAKGEIIDSIVSNTSSISKGYIYANYAKAEKEANGETIEAKKDTDYEVNYTAKVYDKTLTSEVAFETIAEKYIDSSEEEHSSKVNNKETIYSKTVKIAETVFDKMLGEEGKIEITNKEGEKLGEITNDTNKDASGNYVADISEAKENEVIIKTSKPITEGNIIVTVEKAISAEQSYTKEEMESFEKITLGVITKSYATIIETSESAENEDNTEVQTENTSKTVEVTNSSKSAEIKLTEPVSKAEISIGTENLSTVIENENVELRVVLDTSSIENALYKNPTFKIELPSCINKVDIKNTNMLMDGELTIKNVKPTTENDKQVIYIELEGTQTEYTINAEYKGTIIVLNTDLTVETLTPTNTNKITMTYTNENESSIDFIGKAEETVNFIAPIGVVAANGIANYSEDGEDIMSISAQSVDATIETYTEKKIATVTGKVINNYANEITDVVILGRLPSENNKIIDSEEELGSTFTATLNTAIKVTGIEEEKYTIYYSELEDATLDLTDEINNWTTTATTEAKSYMIVTNDYVMKAGDVIDFEYNIEIPANLTYNNSSYEMYKVYYNNVSSVGTLAETKVSAVVGATTGIGPELEVSVEPLVETTVREGQIVRMVATIKNSGGIKAENVELKITAPEGTVHTEIREGELSYTDSSSQEKVISIGDIAVGETITKDYELRIEKGVTNTILQDPETGEEYVGEEYIIEEHIYPGDKEIQNVVRVSADNLDNEIQSAPYTFTVLEGDLAITNIPSVNESEILKSGRNITYKVKVENISNDKNLTNVIFKTTLPEGITINDVYYGDTNSLKEKSRENITINENAISINLGELDSIYAYMNELVENENVNSEVQTVELRTQVYICIECTVDDFTGELMPIMTVSADNIEEHYSNIKRHYSEEVKLTFVQSDLDEQYIKEGSQYTYHFIVENVGNISSTNNKIEMIMPDGLSFVKAEYTYQGKEITQKVANEGKISVIIYELAPGEKVDLAVTVKADLLPDQNDKEITTVATLEANGFDKIESNTIKVIIEYDPDAHTTGNNGNTNVAKRYKITGTAWIDENQDGKRDSEEEILTDIPVLLIYKEDNSVVKDPDTNEEKKTTTGSDGTYQFDNLLVGEYLVLFLYDASKYSLTTYQAEDVAETLNSDTINISVVLNGEKRVAGITDVIKITNSNARNIDIGVYVAEKFDLRLDKSISKVTITTPTAGTKVYTYDNVKIIKQDVYGKDVNNSSIIVEYKIVVTNEGQVAGYARKIVDYLPEDAKFSTEINQDWYLSDNTQNVYNTSLADTILQPGESKELTLVLSFNITDKNIGNTINNNAEIYEAYNEQGLLDIDSETGNKVSSEDDISAADIVLSVATGKIIIYITLIITIIIILGIGVFEIKKRVLIKKN